MARLLQFQKPSSYRLQPDCDYLNWKDRECIDWERKNYRPMWRSKLTCDERIVNRVPSLYSLSYAKVIESDLQLELKDFLKSLPIVPIAIIYKYYCPYNECDSYKRSFCQHITVSNSPKLYRELNRYNQYIVHVYPHTEYEVVHKSLVNTNAADERKFSCKRKLFD